MEQHLQRGLPLRVAQQETQQHQLSPELTLDLSGLHLALPNTGKHGWEQRHHHNTTAGLTGDMMVSPAESGTGPQRSRSSTVVFQPDATKNLNLPCVIVHDMTDELEDLSPAEAAKPVEELMLDA